MHRAALAILLALLAGSAEAQTIRSGPLELDLAGRLQFQLNTTSVDAAEAGVTVLPGTVFEIRRVRFGTAMRFDDWLGGVIEVDFADGAARLTDGFVDAILSDALNVRVGQFKKPFGLIELTSSTQTLTIERGARIRGLSGVLGGVVPEEQALLTGAMYQGRDLGVMVHGAAGRFGYAAGLFNGSGANVREEEASKAYAGRVTLRPGQLLALGAAVSRQPARPGVAGDPEEDPEMGTAWGVDADYGRFRRPGLRVMAEAVVADNQTMVVPGESRTLWGAQVATGWFSPREGRVEGVEPVLRLSFADPDGDRSDDAGLLITPGLNLYFTGRNRLMLNGDIYVPQGDVDPAYAVIAQLQVYF